MSYKELAVLVSDMRHAQKEYFRTGSNGAMESAKRLERKVDDACRKILDDQKRMFPEE